MTPPSSLLPFFPRGVILTSRSGHPASGLAGPSSALYNAASPWSRHGALGSTANAGVIVFQPISAVSPATCLFEDSEFSGPLSHFTLGASPTDTAVPPRAPCCLTPCWTGLVFLPHVPGA